MTEHTIRIIKRGGADGTKYPVNQKEITFGTESTCDIRVKIPTVDKVHTRLQFEHKQVKLLNISEKNPTKVNGVPVVGECALRHGDVFTIIDRSFRYESTIETQIAEAEKENVEVTPPPKPRKSKIQFGPELTPEEFDKKLPVIRPVSKGRTPPRRGSTGFSILKGADKTKTAGVLVGEDKSPEKLTVDTKEPGTPVKATENEPGTVPVMNLIENIRETREIEPATEKTEHTPSQESVENHHAESNENDECTTTPQTDNVQPAEPENLNKSIAEEPTSETKPRLSAASSDASSDNIIIYDTESEPSQKSDQAESITDKPELNSTIDDFLANKTTESSPTDDNLNETQKSEIIELETSSRVSEVLTTPNISVSDTSAHSEVIDLNKSVSEDGASKEGKPRLQSEGSSVLSTESDDNIVIYDTTPESAQNKSDKTELEESMVTEPGLNTTIDDFLKENKETPTTTPAEQTAPPPRRSARKSVRFGPMLSPQEYDKDMPANTPIRRGGLPGRFSVPNPQLSAGRTPLRKSVAVCGTPVGQLKLDESLESLDSLDSANQDSATRAKTQRRKTMTPKEVKANIAWAELQQKGNSEQKKTHVDSPIVTQTPKSMPKASIPLVLEEEESTESPAPAKRRSSQKQAASGSKVFGKLPNSAKTPVSAKVGNPAKCRPSPPTPVPFIAKGLQKPQSLHTALQKAAGKKAMIQQSQIPKPKTPMKRKSTATPAPSKAVKTPRKSTAKAPTRQPTASVEEIREKLEEKKREVLQKRKSIQAKRKSVGPKTWATVASKLTKSPWKAATAANTVKLPPKTPLRQRALKAMGKTKVVKKEEPKPPAKIGTKRKSTGVMKPVTKPIVKRKSISTKTPAKKVLPTKVTSAPTPQSPLATVVNPQTLDTLLKAPRGSPQAELITSAIMKQCEEALRSSFSEDPVESKEVPLKKLEEVLCDENREIKEEVNVEELVEIFSEDYQPDSVDQLCKMMDPIVMMQYEKNPDFDFGSVQNIMKSTESGPEIDPAALRKLFKTPKKPKKSECLDAVAMMRLFANPNLIKKKRQSAVIDGEALNILFDEAVEACDVEQLYKPPNSEGKIVTEKEATNFLRRSSLALRKTLLPGDLSRLFTIENYFTDSGDSDDEAPALLGENLPEAREDVVVATEDTNEEKKHEIIDKIDDTEEKMDEPNETTEETDEVKVDETDVQTEEVDAKADDVEDKTNDDDDEPEQAEEEMEDAAKSMEDEATDDVVNADDSDKENEEPLVTDDVLLEDAAEVSDEVKESDSEPSDLVKEPDSEPSELVKESDSEPSDLVLLDVEEKPTDDVPDFAELSAGEVHPLDEEGSVKETKPVPEEETEEQVGSEEDEYTDNESEEDSGSEEEMTEEDPILQQQVETLCAVITPMVRRRWSENKSYDFGALNSVLKLREDDQPPEIDPCSMRKMFGTPRRKSSANKEAVIDPVSLIKLFLNPDVTKKTSEEVIELDPVALQNLFRLPKEPKPEQEMDLDPEALMNLFYSEVEEEEVSKLYKPLELESVTQVLDKARRVSRKSTLPGDICKLFVSENVPSSPGAPNVDDVITKFSEEVKVELSKPTPRRGGRRRKQDPAAVEPAADVKPTRSRRARKPTVEKEETVVKVEDSAVEAEQPKRRGRKAPKEVTKPVEPAVEETATKTPDAELNEEVIDEAPKRRGRGRQAIVEDEKVDVVEKTQEEPEPAEVSEPPSRRGRARRAKSEEDVVAKPAELDTVAEPEQETVSRRGRRGRAVEVKEAEPPTRSSRRRKGATEVNDEVGTKTTDEAEPAAEPVTPAPKRRGRSAKPEKESEVTEPEKPASTRPRRGRGAQVSINEEVETHEIESGPVEPVEPVSKPTPRRGRRAKTEDEPKPVTPARGRRANLKEEPVSEKTPARGRRAKTVEVAEPEVTAPTPRRGRRGKAIETEEVVEIPAKRARRGKTPTPPEPTESSSPAPKTRRGRTAAKKVEPVEKPASRKRGTRANEEPDRTKRTKTNEEEEEYAALQEELSALEEEEHNLTLEEAILDDIIAKSPAAKPATRRGRAAAKTEPSPKKPATRKVSAKATPSPKKAATKKASTKKPAAKKTAAAKPKKRVEVEEPSHTVKKPRLSTIKEESTPAKRKTSQRKPPAKKSPAKKTPVKKTPAKKTPVKKTAAKKTPVKKTATKKTPVKKTAAKKTPTKSSTPKKSPAQRVTRSKRR